MKVAVIAHNGKTLGGGLSELRSVLVDYGVADPMWEEVDKSRRAPERLRSALKSGPDLVVVWGGDGMVQRCLDVLAGSDVAVAIIPAGTANLLATNLDIPTDIGEAVRIALLGARRRLDLGSINGECFAVMGGAGFDGIVMSDVNANAKEHFGRVAYVRSSVKAMKARRVDTTIAIDGEDWYSGPSSCVLVGNVGTIIGGMHVFDDARTDDALLDIGVVTAEGAKDWARVLGRLVAHSDVDRSPFVRTIQAAKIDVRFGEKVPYEIDGSARGKTKHLKVRVRPRAVNVCVPVSAAIAAPDRVRTG